jgi:hypothetical protein
MSKVLENSGEGILESLPACWHVLTGLALVSFLPRLKDGLRLGVRRRARGVTRSPARWGLHWREDAP